MTTVTHTHGHGHAHTHGHAHPHGDTKDRGHFPGEGSPVFDIGDGVGALVVLLAADTATGELHACPVSDPLDRFHTGVHHRDLGGGPAWTAVFPEVEAGAYHLLDDDGAPLAHVTVSDGTVHQLDLR